MGLSNFGLLSNTTPNSRRHLRPRDPSRGRENGKGDASVWMRFAMPVRTLVARHRAGAGEPGRARAAGGHATAGTPAAGSPSGPVIAMVDPEAAGRPTRLVLQGALDPTAAPALTASIATAAGPGRLLIDANAVDRFSPTSWVALHDARSRAITSGAAVEITGLHWAQVLDVLAAEPVSQIRARVAEVRALLRHTDLHRQPAPATRDVAPPAGPEQPEPPPPPPDTGSDRSSPTPRPPARKTISDHLPRDWARSDQGSTSA